MTANDPYAFCAARLLPARIKDIRDFWAHFAAHADGLDRTFSTGMAQPDCDPATIMSAITAKSPELMWEFGPAADGHDLCITAEWTHANRALAKAYIDLAPSLPRRTFSDARSPNPTDHLDANFQSRFGSDCALTQVTMVAGDRGKIDLLVSGNGTDVVLSDHAVFAASFLLGEANERDWIGSINIVPPTTTPKKGWFGQAKIPAFDPAAFITDFEATRRTLQDAQPHDRLSDTDIDARGATLLNINGLPDTSGRPDLRTFVTPSMSYANAALARNAFASVNHSRHGETFVFLRIPHDGTGTSDARDALEVQIHAALADAQLGGLMAGGHGTDAYYIDIGLTDIDGGLARLAYTFAAHTTAKDITVHFLDVGLAGYDLHLTEARKTRQ